MLTLVELEEMTIVAKLAATLYEAGIDTEILPRASNTLVELTDVETGVTVAVATGDSLEAALFNAVSRCVKDVAVRKVGAKNEA